MNERKIGGNSMAEYRLNYRTIVEKRVSIEAKSAEEAFMLWQYGEYDNTEIDDEYIHGDTIQINGVDYNAQKFECLCGNLEGKDSISRN